MVIFHSHSNNLLFSGLIFLFFFVGGIQRTPFYQSLDLNSSFVLNVLRLENILCIGRDSETNGADNAFWTVCMCYGHHLLCRH